MNRRRIRRQLATNNRTFWGSRRFLTLRLPASVVPAKPDLRPMDVYGTREDLFGPAWFRKTSLGTYGLVIGVSVSSGCIPRDDGAQYPKTTIFRLRKDSYGYRWSDIRHSFRPAKDRKFWFKALYFRTPRAHVDLVQQYLDWLDTVNGSYDAVTTNDLVKLLTSYWSPKTHYVSVTDRYFEFTYSVKPQYVRYFAKEVNGILNELDSQVRSGVLPPYKVMRHG